MSIGAELVHFVALLELVVCAVATLAVVLLVVVLLAVVGRDEILVSGPIASVLPYAGAVGYENDHSCVVDVLVLVHPIAQQQQ